MPRLERSVPQERRKHEFAEIFFSPDEQSRHQDVFLPRLAGSSKERIMPVAIMQSVRCPSRISVSRGSRRCDVRRSDVILWSFAGGYVRPPRALFNHAFVLSFTRRNSVKGAPRRLFAVSRRTNTSPRILSDSRTRSTDGAESRGSGDEKPARC